ncbi:Dedicator of cytokinesis protein 4 [Labeo rohita]|uniref:Dedicator of cytokinesis protein 4 n=1 Tax=Labeo rohita TaxID=84645 RepID=A0ABQ8LCE9_LABRO|nr:Dedicator of cytokinesis protein 4 [Labeo rohita]
MLDSPDQLKLDTLVCGHFVCPERKLTYGKLKPLTNAEWPPSYSAHKSPGDAGRVSGTETLPPGPERSPCVGAHQQHIGGLLLKPPGRSAFVPLVQAGAPDPVESVPGGISSHKREARFCISAWSCGSCGCAPEGAHLVASGLSTKVVETILQSRAPSMRKLYAWKRRLFTSWCGNHQLDPVHCPVGTVLEFLQARFTAGLTHSMAAIAAFHSPLGGQSAHSTQSMAASKAFSSGVPLSNICNAAGWSTLLTFVRFYSLDIHATPDSSVLSS